MATKLNSIVHSFLWRKNPWLRPMDSTERVAFTVRFSLFMQRTPMPGEYKTVLLNLIVLVDGEAEAELCVDQ